MKRRSNLHIVALLLLLTMTQAVADAQQPTMVAPVGGPDPYAMTPTASNPYLWGNGFAIPTTNTLIRDRVWVSVDYLLWWPQGMEVTPLVTSSPVGPPPGGEGILGRNGTSILYGGDELNDSSANGIRLRTGWWFRQGAWALESEFFGFNSSTEDFSASGDGSRILARPYFDIVDGQQDSRLISFPGLHAGSVAVSSDSRLRSGLINVRASLIPIRMLGFNDPTEPPDRVDWIIGYRALELEDNFSVSDSRTSLVPGASQTTSSTDSFSTKNRFNGLQLGFAYQAHFWRLTMESRMRVALGDNRRTASINGGTTITNFGVTNSYNGGLLAQRSNIGDFEQSEFTMIPELGFNFSFRATRCLHFTVGYNVIYFPNVWRASEQIDPDLNPTLFPPETVALGALRPQFRAIEDDYWANGLNFGAELRF